MRNQIINILNALYEAKSGEVIYKALREVPINNLKDMKDMISHILNEEK